MKRCGLIVFAMHVYVAVCATNIQWDGEAGDGLWSTLKNWEGDLLPTATDDVLLNNKFILTDYIVYLPSGSGSVQIKSLHISPLPGAKITVILPSSNTSLSAFLALGNDDAIIIDSGATIINASGASTGTPLAVTSMGNFRINNGGRYIHRTERGHTTNLANRLSTAPGTEKGIFEFDVPSSSFIVSFTGRTYGTIVFSSQTRNGPVSYNGNGVSSLIVGGDMIVNERCTVSSGMSGDISIKGNLIVNENAIFNLQNTTPNNLIRLVGDLRVRGTLMKSGLGVPTIIFEGVDTQNVRLQSKINHNIYLSIQNDKGLRLLNPLITRSQINFVKGNINASDENPLLLLDTAHCFNANDNSLVAGPVWWTNWIRDSCEFPIGQASIFMPVKVYGKSSGSNDTIKASYFRANPQSKYGVNYDNGIDHISFVEYWIVKGVTQRTLVLPVTRSSFITDLGSTNAVRLDQGTANWLSVPIEERRISTSIPPYQSGWMKTGILSGDGVFSFGTNQSVIDNPLPVLLIKFSGERRDKKIVFTALLVSVCDKVRQLFIAGSNDGIKFTPLTTSFERKDCWVKASIDETAYPFYQMKIRSSDGEYISQVLAIEDETKHEAVSFYPTITNGKLTLEMQSENESVISLEFISMNGNVNERQALAIHKGNNKILLDVSRISSGWTVIRVIQNGKVIAIRKIRIVR